jgi:ABC-type transport system involved in multi-copper enzyme maturation permease subunit
MTTQQWVTVGLLAAAALVVAAAAVSLCTGLFQARSLVRRELAAYFVSPIAYVVLAVFLVVTGHLFAQTYALLTTTGPRGTEWPMQTMFADERFWYFWLVFLFIPPLLTMRLFAEERGSGTLEMLMTAPLRDWQVVLAKYLACLAFYVIIWLPTLLYLPALLGAGTPVFRAVWTPYSLLFLGGLAALLVGLVSLLPRLGSRARMVAVALILGGAAAALVGGLLHYHRDAEHLLEIPISADLDPAPVLATYLGMFLAGAMFLAIGLLVSSLVRDQIVAAVGALALGLVFVLGGFLPPGTHSLLPYRLVYFFSVPLHFHDTFTRGRIDTRPVVLYASTTLLCLFLTVRMLERRRWQ